jgi:predicted branched-subunit amino acid permease
MIAEGPVVFTVAGMRRGVRQAAPLLIGMAPFGLVCGIAAQGAGLSLGGCVFMSAIVFAGSAQIVALAAWGHPVSILTATLAAFAVNLRLALMGPVLSPWLDRLRGWRLWGSLFVMADQNWAQAVTEMNAGGRDAALLFGSGASLWLMWVTTSAAGFLVGAWLRPPPGHPLFFAALAVFVAFLVPMWRGRGDLLPWGVAALVALAVARLLPGTSWHIVAGALAGSLVAGLRDHWCGSPGRRQAGGR